MQKKLARSKASYVLHLDDKGDDLPDLIGCLELLLNTNQITGGTAGNTCPGQPTGVRKI